MRMWRFRKWPPGGVRGLCVGVGGGWLCYKHHVTKGRWSWGSPENRCRCFRCRTCKWSTQFVVCGESTPGWLLSGKAYGAFGFAHNLGQFFVVSQRPFFAGIGSEETRAKSLCTLCGLSAISAQNNPLFVCDTAKKKKHTAPKNTPSPQKNNVCSALCVFTHKTGYQTPTGAQLPCDLEIVATQWRLDSKDSLPSLSGL